MDQRASGIASEGCGMVLQAITVPVELQHGNHELFSNYFAVDGEE